MRPEWLHNNPALRELMQGLQEDLSREYQAIIAYTVYSNVLKGAQWMSIAGELKKHAQVCTQQIPKHPVQTRECLLRDISAQPVLQTCE
jgi:hypothetical protein